MGDAGGKSSQANCTWNTPKKTSYYRNKTMERVSLVFVLGSEMDLFQVITKSSILPIKITIIGRGFFLQFFPSLPRYCSVKNFYGTVAIHHKVRTSTLIGVLNGCIARVHGLNNNRGRGRTTPRARINGSIWIVRCREYRVKKLAVFP